MKKITVPIIMFLFLVITFTFIIPIKLNSAYTKKHFDINDDVPLSTKPKPSILKNTYLMLVNKNYFVEKDYTPKNLVNPKDFEINTANNDVLVPIEVLTHYIRMVNELDLINLYIFSGYRNYAKQEILYNYYRDDNYSAKPGFSEHHTGFALDLSTLESGLEVFFSRTKEYEILINNSYKYGFILRYPIDKSHETGYLYEPWHFRYVGVIHAKRMYLANITLEQYIKENFDF